MVWLPLRTFWPSCISILYLLALPRHSFQVSVLGERAFRQLSPDGMRALISSPDPTLNMDPANPDSHLSKILIPRAPDTANNTLVKDYIISTLKNLNWQVEEDTFTGDTPYGSKRFTNVIATKDPDASRRVIVAAHFDSKYFPTFPQNQFLGATDSAAPCAMMLDLAETLNSLLDKRKERLDAGLEDDEDVSDTTLQLIFFDGEEAFKDWTATDSIYGAKHLAEKWANTFLFPHAKRRMMNAHSPTEIDTIEHFILLDLLGAPNPQIISYFADTGWLFDAMVSSESRLNEIGAFKYGGNADVAPPSFFVPRRGSTANFGYVEDDHVPFLRLGVNILHIIPSPFPRVWHTLSDDASALDIPTMRQWNMILRIFMAEYLHLRSEPTDSHPSFRSSARNSQRSVFDLNLIERKLDCE